MKRLLNLWLLAALMLAAGILLVIVGCESDPTVPEESPPPISQDAAVEQAAAFTDVVINLLDEMMVPSKEMVIQPVMFESVTGYVTLDYRCGGPDGTEEGCTGTTPLTDYLNIFTDSSPPEPWDPQQIDLWQDFGLGDGPQVIASVKGSVVVYPYNNTATPQNGQVSGQGTVESGTYVSSWSINGVQYAVGDYPESGEIVFTSNPTVVNIAFDGTVNALITVGTDSYILNLDTGEITESGGF